MLNMKVNKENRQSVSLIKAFTLLATLTVSLLNLNSAVAAGDIINGEQLSQTCLGCHGAPGLRNPGPVYSIPMLGAQNAEYIVIALKAYKDKTRTHKTMQAQAASLSDQDMQDIAAYFAGIEGEARISAISASKIAAGKKLAGACAACHGNDGATTTTPDFPKLAGQYESYLAHALKEYRSGDRDNAIMAGFAKQMTIEDIEALSAWFASQEADGVVAPKTTIFKFK